MSDDYPYMISNNKISPIIDSIHSAAKPQKFSHEFLKKLGFNSSNDRAVIPLFKRLGFLTESGAPSSHYDDLKDTTKRSVAMAERIRELYSDIYAINTSIHSGSEEEIKGALSRVTGKDAISVGRYYATFKTLIGLADFKVPSEKHFTEEVIGTDEDFDEDQVKSPASRKNSFHYNIQIHLPATTDISVYNAIFKSLKENLDL